MPHRLSLGTLTAIGLAALGSTAWCAEPVKAIVESSLPTAEGQPRQFAFDGNRDSCYVGARDAGSHDHVTLRLDRPVAVSLVSAVTGKPDGDGELGSGVLEVSSDGEAFETVARLEAGSAHGDLGGRAVRALRIRPDGPAPQPLVVRELALVSEPPVERFRYPVEFVADASDAPELQAWADKVARLCERTYAMIVDELKAGRDLPPHWVRMRLTTGYRGVAMASGNRITGAVRYFKAHPDDVGAMVHESVHVVQRYRGRNPSWLVEGVSDYVRFFKFEPGNLGRIDPERAHYNQSYRVSAAFLAYLTDNYDRDIVPKLHRLMRTGKYNDKAFEDWTGKTLAQLDDEWRSTLKNPRAKKSGAPEK